MKAQRPKASPGPVSGMGNIESQYQPSFEVQDSKSIPGAADIISPVMPSKLLFDPFELPMKALSLLACPVVIDHGR